MQSIGLVRAYVATHLGSEVVQVQRLAGSVANDDFRVRMADGRSVLLKVGPRREMKAEAWACRTLLDAAFPVPEVLAGGVEFDAGRTGLILSWMPGAPSDALDVLAQAGVVLRRIHAIELPGWGALVPGTGAGAGAGAGEAHGMHDSWAQVVEEQLAGLPELTDAGIVTDAVAELATSLVGGSDLISYDGPGVLLHNDLKAAHLFAEPCADGERLSAVIDWGDVSVGDPRVDLARMSMAGPTAMAAFLRGYGQPTTRAQPDDLARYRIMWNVDALTYEYRAGGEWFDTYRERILADLELLT